VSRRHRRRHHRRPSTSAIASCFLLLVKTFGVAHAIPFRVVHVSICIAVLVAIAALTSPSAASCGAMGDGLLLGKQELTSVSSSEDP
jgi:hypothetical protein